MKSLVILGFAACLTLALGTPGSALVQGRDEPGTDEPRAAPLDVNDFKGADAIFTARIGKVNPLGQTNAIPASVFGNISFKDVKALRGNVPADAKYTFSYREGSAKKLDFTPNVPVLVVARQKAVTVIAPASEANLALAHKALDARK